MVKPILLNTDKMEWVPILSGNGFLKILRRNGGLTQIFKIVAPPKGKLWKIQGTAAEGGEEVYILKGGFCNQTGKMIYGPSSYAFRPEGNVHAAFVKEETIVLAHFCGGNEDRDVTFEMVDLKR